MPFINKVETETQLEQSRHIARLVLKESRVDRVLVGAARNDIPVSEVHKRVVAAVLAAGLSQRMGRSKPLIPWGDTTILGQTLRNLKESLLHDIFVVTGHQAQQVERAATQEGIAAHYNPQYARGEMLSSLKAAVKMLPDNVAAVLVMLADQPLVAPEIIDQLLQAYWQGFGELIAPSYQGRRGNPVLIGRPYFEELLSLPPEAAPRELLRRHPGELHLVSVESDAVLLDLDRPEDVERWRP
jgi:molybdenum cofactor cytidylyltransferase